MNLDSIVNEGNRTRFLYFIRELLRRVTSEFSNPGILIMLIEDVDHAIGRETIDTATVIAVSDQVLKHTHCPSLEECLEVFHTWKTIDKIGLLECDKNRVLDAILNDWYKSSK